MRARRAHVGEELELLAQPDVDRAEAGADRRGERALEREGVLPDALDRGVGQRRAGGVHRRHPGQLLVPVEAEPAGLEHVHRLGGDLGPDPVARDEGDVVGHRRDHCSGSTASSAAARAASGVGAGCRGPGSARRPCPVRVSAATSESSARTRPAGIGPEAERGGDHRRRGRRRPPSGSGASARSGSGTSLSLGERSMRLAHLVGIARRCPGARRATFRSSGGSTQCTSGRAADERLADDASRPRSGWRAGPGRRRRGVSAWKAGSVATSVSGMTATSWPASPSVGTGSVGTCCAASGSTAEAAKRASVTTKEGRRTAGR